MKRHHKFIIGGAGSIVFIFMVVTGIIIYGMHVKQEIYQNKIDSEISQIRLDLNQISDNLLQESKNIEQVSSELNQLDSELGGINKEFDELDDEFSELKFEVGEDFSNIITDVVKSVVTVRTDVGQGTGFVIDSEGYIVTNAHVLSGGSELSILDYEQNSISASLVGYDEEFDVALLKVNEDYNSLELADSDQVEVGQKVIAIGNPLGLQFSVSEGIISQLHRPGPNGIKAYIQTDAALNPGNSGGPLIDKKGNVIGINNFKVGGSESLGFALESNYVKEVVNEISQEELNQTLIE